MEPKASIGRIVHYQSHGSPNGQHKSEPRAAVVTWVHPDVPEVVGLCVLNPSGIYFDDDVEYDVDGGPGTWRWPPRV